MRRWIFPWLVLALCLGAAGCASRPPAALAPARSYLRVREATNQTVSLDVAVRTFSRTNRPGPPVLLVGVTHLGDAPYYAGLQRLLDVQPLVLFEGVGAKDKRFMAERDGGYALQPALARALGLRFQLETIDYRGSNFVNSDLTIPQLQHVLESGPAPDGGQLGDLMAMMDGSSWMGIFVRFGLGFVEANPRLRATVRLVMIETLGAVDGDLAESKALPAEVRRLMEVLIAERNKAVVDDLRRSIDAAVAARGKQAAAHGGIAVFYGAGHMVDLEKRLGTDLGYAPVAEEWRTAFAVDPVAAGLTEAEIKFARTLVRDQLKELRAK